MRTLALLIVLTVAGCNVTEQQKIDAVRRSQHGELMYYCDRLKAGDEFHPPIQPVWGDVRIITRVLVDGDMEKFRVRDLYPHSYFITLKRGVVVSVWYGEATP